MWYIVECIPFIYTYTKEHDNSSWTIVFFVINCMLVGAAVEGCLLHPDLWHGAAGLSCGIALQLGVHPKLRSFLQLAEFCSDLALC